MEDTTLAEYPEIVHFKETDFFTVPHQIEERNGDEGGHQEEEYA